MSALPLTPRQERVWRYIRGCDRSPTYQEMADALGFSSKSQLNPIVLALRERGFVTYIPWRRRTLRALDPRTDLASISTEALIAELKRRRP